MLEILGIIVIVLIIVSALALFYVVAYSFHMDKNYDYDDEITEYLKNHRKSQEENQ